MSKSTASEKGIVHVLDEPDRIVAKFRSAVTDSDGSVRIDRAAKPGVTNLLEILAATTGRTVEAAAEAHADDGYGALKNAVAEAVIEFLQPIRTAHALLAADPGEMTRRLASGAERARAVAAPTFERAREAMGLLAPG